MTGMVTQATSGSVRIRFFAPSAELSAYITTYYLLEVDCSAGEEIEDFLHPEWCNLRLVDQGHLRAAIGEDPLKPIKGIVATGPTSLTTRFCVSQGRYWGIGLLPAGWARFVDAPAGHYADSSAVVGEDPAFGALVALADIFDPAGDIVKEAAAIDEHMLSLLARPSHDEERILAVHRALMDHNIESVAEFAAQLAMSTRSLERLAKQAFGFPPKLLLRRQRFLRCLARFMLDPSLKWLNTMDWQYHDQAHFTRDFRRFMTMAPSQYAKLDHPVLKAAAFARMQAFGQAVQVLHQPDGTKGDCG